MLLVLTLGLAAAWQAVHRDASMAAVELDTPAHGQRRTAVLDDALELPSPEAPPASAAGALAEQGARNRRPVPPPSPPDYEARYAGWAPMALARRVPELQQLIERAKSARFDQLHARFAELRAANLYGARVTELGKAFEGVPLDLDHARDVSARVARQPDGTFVMHVLEFRRAEEPATANLVGELAWIKARLKL
ncbi:MAG TPA: hypothetical protein VM509_09800 [Planctomycetota bacterium]|nr:hypothetical protein [Planctomycetota bacterium]